MDAVNQSGMELEFATAVEALATLNADAASGEATADGGRAGAKSLIELCAASPDRTGDWGGPDADEPIVDALRRVAEDVTALTAASKQLRKAADANCE